MCCCFSVTKSCLTLRNPTYCSTPAFPVLHFLPEFAQNLELVMPSNQLILGHPVLLLPSIYPSIRVFPVRQLFVSGVQSIGASASTSVLPMNIQV